jgi:hypothetical protein
MLNSLILQDAAADNDDSYLVAIKLKVLWDKGEKSRKLNQTREVSISQILAWKFDS